MTCMINDLCDMTRMTLVCILDLTSHSPYDVTECALLASSFFICS